MPPFASRKMPGEACLASVKAPWRWPKNSLSTSGSGDRAAIDRNERPLAARSIVVDGAGGKFLAGAGFAFDEDRRIALRDARD